LDSAESADKVNKTNPRKFLVSAAERMVVLFDHSCAVRANQKMWPPAWVSLGVVVRVP
jgi:hypothetical protein